MTPFSPRPSSSSPRAEVSRDASRPAGSTFRTDVQGLRSLAVLLVFADHTFGWPTGGFLGVDVFFVISGFLITSLLLREYARTGTISFRRFYLARAKRIVPAATVVLLFSVMLAFVFFTRQRALATASDAVWAFVFGANWNAVFAGTDYFRQGASTSPLQHYWSLSVEEQFYFVWPWLLLGVLLVCGRLFIVTDRVARVVAGSTIVAVITVSFVWAVHQSTTEPTVAYFSSFTRGWELGLGALVAIITPSFLQLPAVVRTLLAYTGLIGILSSSLLISSTTLWPAPGALFPALSTALVLAAGVGTEPSFLWPLRNPCSVFVGDISYSLYLWHFPAIVFGHALYPDAGPWVYPGIALVGFALAIAQYYAIEVPIWRSSLGKGKGSRAWANWRSTYGEHAKNASLGGLVVIGVVIVGIAFVPAPKPAVDPGTTSAPSSTPSPGASTSPAVSAAERAVTDALAATTWPDEITPPIDEVGADSKVTAWITDGCLALERGAENDPASTVARCVYGPANASKKIAVVGDSIAISWLPALQGAFPDAQIHVVTMQQCPFADVTVVKQDKTSFPQCDAFHALAARTVAEVHPDLTVLSQAQNSVERLRGGTSMSDGFASAIRTYAASSTRTVVLSPPPNTKTVSDCYTPTGSPRNCVSTVSPLSRTTIDDLRAAADRGGVGFVDTLPLMCANGLCPAIIDGKVVSADGAHPTQVFSASLAPAFAELLSRPTG